jgi:hypothetical protein
MRADSGMTVVVIPAIHTDRTWLDREALRIAAGVHGATRDNVARRVYLRHLSNGVYQDEAADDAALAIAWIDARLDQIKSLRAAPPLLEPTRWKA